MYKPKFLLLLAVLMLFSVSSAYALTPANTEIKNSAAATFYDVDENEQNATSNEVITTVEAVYGITITPDGDAHDPGQSQVATKGAIVYYQYTLCNTGNKVDSYTIGADNDLTDDFNPTNIKVYRDANGDGVPDPGEPEIYVSGTGATNIAAESCISLVMAYQIPTSSTINSGDSCFVDITGTSQGDPGEQDTGNYNGTGVVDDAVIVGNKSVDVTEAAAGDTLEYTINVSNTGNKPTTDDTLDVNGTDYYGVMIADVLPVFDSYPFRVIDGTPSGTPNSGNVLYWVHTTSPTIDDSLEQTEWTDGTWYASLAAAQAAEDGGTGNYIRAIGWITGGTTLGSGVISAGQSFNFVYDLRIPVDFHAGNVYNTARFEYDRADSVESSYKTNTVTTTVGGSGYEVLANNVHPHYSYTNEISNPHDLIVAGDDTLEITTISAGDVKTYTFTVVNHGYSTQTIDLILGDKPNGWAFGFYMMDGITALADNNVNGFEDTGALAPGDSLEFKVKVTVAQTQLDGADSLIYFFARSAVAPVVTTLPQYNTTINGAFTHTNGTDPDTLTLTDATNFAVGDFIVISTVAGNYVRRISEKSGNDIVLPNIGQNVGDGTVVTDLTKYNRTSILFENVVGPAVEYRNRTPYNSSSTSFTGYPADSLYVDMPLTVRNPATNYDTYTLSDSLPTGWTIEYYRDADCQGDLDASELTQISDVGIAGGDTACVYARVYYPANTQATTIDSIVKLVATSTNNTSVADTIRNYVEIEEKCAVVFSPNRSATVSPGYTVEYLHVLMNQSNTALTTGGASYFTVSNSDTNWTYVLYQENPASPGTYTQLAFDGTNHDLAYEIGVNATADSTSNIKVKVFVPASAPDAQVDLATITFIPSCGASYSDYVEDQTTVVVSNLELTKRVVNLNAAPDTAWANAVGNNTGAPGDTLIYYVYFKNISTGTIDTLSIYDAIPGYSDGYTRMLYDSPVFLDDTQAEVAGRRILYSNDNGATYTYSPANQTQAENVTNIKFDYATGASGNWITLDPGDSGWIKFKVIIQ
jgi:uncharacterized repeat protein (TIGR01451 family)